jgi:hypothetical protein
MTGEYQSGMQCAEFDLLLTEALDGLLQGERRERFEAHAAGCPACRALFEDARSGLALLREVEDVEPPRQLVHNILALTSQAAPAVEAASMRMPLWMRLRQSVRSLVAPVLTPRFAMSLGMAFFSITLVLNMAQIRIRDLTPHNLSHTFYTSQNKVMKYYENMRLVYEIESRVRELKNSSDDGDNQEKQKKNDQTREQNENSQPERRNQKHEVVGGQTQWLALRSGSDELPVIAAAQRSEL